MKDPTCNITDNASATKIPPTIAKTNSCLIITLIAPSVPPNASDPVSPIKTMAGGALYQRKPREAPIIAPQSIANSPAPGT